MLEKKCLRFKQVLAFWSLIAGYSIIALVGLLFSAEVLAVGGGFYCRELFANGRKPSQNKILTNDSSTDPFKETNLANIADSDAVGLLNALAGYVKPELIDRSADGSSQLIWAQDNLWLVRAVSDKNLQVFKVDLPKSTKVSRFSKIAWNPFENFILGLSNMRVGLLQSSSGKLTRVLPEIEEYMGVFWADQIQENLIAAQVSTARETTGRDSHVVGMDLDGKIVWQNLIPDLLPTLPSSVVRSPDTRKLYVVGNNQIYVFDSLSGKLVQTYHLQNSPSWVGVNEEFLFTYNRENDTMEITNTFTQQTRVLKRLDFKIEDFHLFSKLVTMLGLPQD